MIRDARKHPPPPTADLVIIGAGAAGITLARALADSPLQVVLLEAGGRRFDRHVQADYRAERVTPWTHFAGELGRRRAFGGTTSLWGGRCIPLDPMDYRARDWIPFSGWPIGIEAIDPYMDGAMEVLQAGAAEFGVETLAGDAGPLAEDRSGVLDLGRVERYSLPLDFGGGYRRDLEAAANLTCLLHAPVLRILAEAGQTRGVETPQGRIAAPRVVLATGGIETARLLLASGLGGAHVGRFYQTHIRVEFGSMRLAESHRAAFQKSRDGVWCRRYIAFDPAAQDTRRLPNAALRPANPPLADPAHGNAILSLIFLVKGVLIDEYRKILVGHRDRTKKALGYGWPLYRRHIGNVLRGIGPLAVLLARWVRQRILPARKLPAAFLVTEDGRYRIDLQFEQVPNPDSRITLGRETDAQGVPRVCIDWRPAAADRDGLARVIEAMQAASQPGRLEFDPGDIDPQTVELFPVPSHHMGTARMASGPETGVCDANCEVFDTKGLYVAGAAAFPTSGFANPTLMIVALALRLAAHLGHLPRRP